MNKLYQKIKEKLQDYHFLYVVLIILRNYLCYFFNRISNYQLEKIKFYRKLGYSLNLKNPQSYNEKIVWKKVYDRNPLLITTSDKYEVRNYIVEILGKKTANKILIPLLFITEKPENIPFDRLPRAFIIKPNHSSGQYIIVKDGKFNKEKIIKTCIRWLKTPYGLDKSEWAYRSIKRKIVIEQLLQDDDGIPPERYYFQMFYGKCKLVHAIIANREKNSVISAYDVKWNLLSVKTPALPQGPKIKKPKNYEIMLGIAEKLSKPFDHVRVDLYNIKGKIYFGELTHYTVSGRLIFKPRSFDFTLGKYWKIKYDYWKTDGKSG